MTDKQKLAEQALLHFSPTSGTLSEKVILEISRGDFSLEDLEHAAEHLNKKGYLQMAGSREEGFEYGLNVEGVEHRDSLK